jgi:hypothetical protein
LFAQTTVADYLFDKDKIFAYLNLDDNELFIYQRLFDLLVRDVPAPDLVIYLQAPTDVLVRRLKERRKDKTATCPTRARLHPRVERGLPALLLSLLHQRPARRRNIAGRSLGERHGRRRPDPQIRSMNRGTRYYVPRT